MNQSDHAAALAVLHAFTGANARGDGEAMKACLSRATLEDGGFSGPMPGDLVFTFGAPEEENGHVVIPMSARPGAAPEGETMMALRCLMIQENGAWKFDLAATMQEQMEAMEAVMRDAGAQMGAVLGAAMESVGEALSTVMESEPESGEIVADFGEEDLHDLAELELLHEATKAVSAAVGKDISVFADVKGLLALLGSDDPDALVPWLDKEFCAALGPAIAAAGEACQKLSSVRIEAPTTTMEHFIALDGEELVYRADVRFDDGWYRHAEDLMRIIPGVVLGMGPGAADVPLGRSSLPCEGSGPTLTRYRQAWVSRAMRDINHAAGGNVSLETSWESFFSESDDGRGLAVWGLCRVPGAIALHRRDHQREPGWLGVIRLENGYGERRASFVDGVLTMAISHEQGEQGCFYEHELAAVFNGLIIGPPADESSDGSSARC